MFDFSLSLALSGAPECLAVSDLFGCRIYAPLNNVLSKVSINDKSLKILRAKQKKRGSWRSLFFVVTDLIIYHKELIG